MRPPGSGPLEGIEVRVSGSRSPKTGYRRWGTTRTGFGGFFVYRHRGTCGRRYLRVLTRFRGTRFKVEKFAGPGWMQAHRTGKCAVPPCDVVVSGGDSQRCVAVISKKQGPSTSVQHFPIFSGSGPRHGSPGPNQVVQ